MPIPQIAGGLALVDQLVRLFTPINRIIDEVHTSDEERAVRRAEAARLQNEALALALELERERLAAQAGLVAAEAGGASWLQRNWRPITMLSFLGLVVADAFGLLALRLADQAWLLLQIGLGGYVVGRSVEKISPQIATGYGQNGNGHAHNGNDGPVRAGRTARQKASPRTSPRTSPKTRANRASGGVAAGRAGTAEK